MTVQQQRARQQHLKFEKELAAIQALIEVGTKREALLQNQTETLHQALHGVEIKTAVAQQALYQKIPSFHKIDF